MKRLIKAEYDAFKDMKIDDKNGRYTDGQGHSYVKDKKYSDSIKYDVYDFKYNYEKEMLEIYWYGKFFDANYLSLGNWLDNPDYWVEQYYKYIFVW